MTLKTISSLIGLFALVNCEAMISTTTREPSLQAYGLPKRILASNGYIERINLGDAVTRAQKHPGDPTGERRKYNVKHESGLDAVLEILHLDDPRRVRGSVDEEDSSMAGNDLRAEESKVFRPLFVYRQQVARRQRIQREKHLAKNTNSLYYYPRYD